MRTAALTLAVLLGACPATPALRAAEHGQTQGKASDDQTRTTAAYLILAYQQGTKCGTLTDDERLKVLVHIERLRRELKVKKPLDQLTADESRIPCDAPFSKALVERVKAIVGRRLPESGTQSTVPPENGPARIGSVHPVEIPGAGRVAIHKCSSANQTGLWLHLQIPNDLPVIRRPFGFIVVRGSDLLSLWENQGVGELGQYWPVDTVRTVAPVMPSGRDVSILRNGRASRAVDIGHVRIQYDAASAESASVFDQIIESACAVTNLDSVEQEHGLDRLGYSTRGALWSIINHPLNEWADVLFPALAKKRPTKRDVDELLTERLQERADALTGLLFSLREWLVKTIGQPVSGAVVRTRLSPITDGPIATTRKGTDGYVIDINTTVLRALFRASRSGGADRGFFTEREWIRNLNPEDPSIEPKVGASFGRNDQIDILTPRLRNFDIMWVRFTDALDFVLLHEIGHIVLGHDLGLPHDACDQRTPLEAQADAFAASILTVRDPYRLRIRRPGVDRDRDPNQSTFRDFFTWAYSVAGFGNVKSVCGYLPAESRRRAVDQVSRLTLESVY